MIKENIITWSIYLFDMPEEYNNARSYLTISPIYTDVAYSHLFPSISIRGIKIYLLKKFIILFRGKILHF